MIKFIEILSIVIFSGILFLLMIGICGNLCSTNDLIFRAAISVAFVAIVWMRLVKRAEIN